MYLTGLGSRGSLPVAARPAGLPSKRLGCMGGLAQACCCSPPAAAHAGPQPMNEINAFESDNAPFVQTCGLSLIACSCQIAGLPHASSRESFQLLDRSQGPQRRVRMQAAIMPQPAAAPLRLAASAVGGTPARNRCTLLMFWGPHLLPLPCWFWCCCCCCFCCILLIPAADMLFSTPRGQARSWRRQPVGPAGPRP